AAELRDRLPPPRQPGGPAERRVSPENVPDLLASRWIACLVRVQQHLKCDRRLDHQPGLLHRRRRLPELDHPVRVTQIDRALRNVPQQLIDDGDIRTGRGELHAVIVLPANGRSAPARQPATCLEFGPTKIKSTCSSPPDTDAGRWPPTPAIARFAADVSG